MKNSYPVRLSVAELYQELEAYLDARREKLEPVTVDADKSHVLGFLYWLETGKVSRRLDVNDLVREFLAEE